VNKDCFKNFIVVSDDNNNDPEGRGNDNRNTGKNNITAALASETPPDEKTTPVTDTETLAGKMVPEQHDINFSRNDSDVPPGQTVGESNDEKRRTNHAHGLDSLIVMTKDDGHSVKSDSGVGMHEKEAEDSVNDAESVVMRQKREVESSIDGVGDDATRIPRSRSSGLQMAASRGRSAQKTDSRSRHLSYPRTKHKHKNESQLRFDGNMDFETTTRRLYRNSEEKEEKDGNRKRISRARDLFRPSDEVDLFHSHRNDKFDGSTTYSLCFQNKQYCPAVDLETGHSEYIFREKTGSHKYYSSVNHLS
jgi:hypothetical protein